MNIRFVLRQYIKTIVNKFFLPAVYKVYCRYPVKKGKILFADGHHHELPYSMVHLYHYVKEKGYETELHLADFGTDSYLSGIKAMIKFMKSYATAECVFLCDYYLPAGSCKKRRETKVVQLWHACGALKKFGYDAEEDISSFYKGNSMKNCTLVTVSSKACEAIYAGAFKVPKRYVKALGISRTDRYMSEAYRKLCIEKFYKTCPEAKGRKVILWAPTFRGNARMPKLEGASAVDRLERQLGKDYYIVRRLHPHLEGKCGVSNCNMLTEEIMPAADLLITDYSSVLFDFMVYKKPIVLFAPDSKKYTESRGFYIDYDRIPAFHAENAKALSEAVSAALNGEMPVSKETYDKFYRKYMEQCDGRATERIVQEVLKNGRD